MANNITTKTNIDNQIQISSTIFYIYYACVGLVFIYVIIQPKCSIGNRAVRKGPARKKEKDAGGELAKGNDYIIYTVSYQNTIIVNGGIQTMSNPLITRDTLAGGVKVPSK